MKVQQLPLGDVKRYENNPRDNAAAVAEVAASIKQFGFLQPLVLDKDRVIVVGDTRYLAAQSLGFQEVPCVLAEHLTDEQVAAFRLADNRVGEISTWNDDRLYREILGLQKVGYDARAAGFKTGDLDRIIAAQLKKTSKVKPADEPPTPEAKLPPVTVAGDVWLIDGHRLICGDATSADVVAALMQDERADMLFTSPPYGSQRQYKIGEKFDWFALMRGVFEHAPMLDDGQILVNLGMVHDDGEWTPYWDDWIFWMRARGWRRFRLYVWDQGHGLPGDWNGGLAPSFELIFHFNKAARVTRKTSLAKSGGEAIAQNKQGLRKADGSLSQWSREGATVQPMKVPDSVIRVSRHYGPVGQGLSHPAPFSVALPAEMVPYWTDDGAVVFDPFGGSGTTMIACQRINRAARLVELAPEYCDVIALRYLQQFPTASIRLQETGETFEDVSLKRLAGVPLKKGASKKRAK